MIIEIGAGGKITLLADQQKWTGENVLQRCLFAGQEMMVIQKSDEEPNQYELHYLGFKSEDIEGVEKAKAKAPAFSRQVLMKMHDMIETK